MLRGFFHRLTATPSRVFALVTVVYFASSFFSTTIRQVLPLPADDHALRYYKNRWAVVSLPRILRGDEMYYLMMAHSLAHDGDLYLSREYTSVQRGGPEMGVYHRHRPAANFPQHFSRDADLTLLGNHPFGFSALLAMMLWPVAGSSWMEPAAIWVNVLGGAMGVLVFVRVLEALGLSWPRARNAALALAFATPWFSYSRTLYTEVWVGTAFLIVLLAALRNRALWTLPFLMGMAWFKYPALLLFFSAGTSEGVQHRRRNFFVFGLAGAAVLCAIYAFNQSYFGGASWITREGVTGIPGGRSMARAGAPIAWIPGKTLSNMERMFTDFDKGLFPHCPLLFVAIMGLFIMARRQRRQFLIILSCALPWTLLHLTYRYLMTGDSYTTRYLVPVVPLALIGLPYFWDWSAIKNRWWRWCGAGLVAISLLNNIIAGVFPATSFDRAPWEVWREFWLIIGRVLIPGSGPG